MNDVARSNRLQALLRQADDHQLAIGHADPDPQTGTSAGVIHIPYSARSAHMHVIGRTRSGKSRFIADLIRQDIEHGHGLCIIDPHGELYDLTVNWLAQNKHVERRRKNIHPVCFTDPTTTFKYNPLHIERPEEAYAVASNVTNAITRVYGGKDSTETPLLWFVLDVACTILALRGLPLAAAKHFLMNSAFDRDLRDRISAGVPNEYYRTLGLEMSRMTPKEFRETVASAGRRLHQFFKNPLVERIFSTTENTASLRQMMDERHVLLLNTSDQGGLIDFDQLRTIGMLFTNNFFATARKRDPETKPTPFLLYIDEAQNYLSNDIEDILSQAAKRGLYLTLSHQFLGQLVEAGELIYNGVMSGTLIKAVFGITMAEADIFADELFAREIDFERVKEKLASPHVVGHEIAKLKSASESRGEGIAEVESEAHTHARSTSSAESFSESESTGESRMNTEIYGASSGLGLGSSLAVPVTGDGVLDATTGTLSASEMTTTGSMSSSVSGQGESRQSGSSRSVSSSESESHATTKGRAVGKSAQKTMGTGESETLKPVFEWFSTQAYTLEEQRYELKRRLAYQEARHGFLAVGRKGTVGFTSRDVPDPLPIPLNKQRLLERLTAASPWLVPASETPNILAHPGLAALQEPAAASTPEPDDYFEPDE